MFRRRPSVPCRPPECPGHAIPVVAVDPRNSDVIAIAEGETRSSRYGLHVSTDTGLTWREGANPQPASEPRCVRNTEGPIADLTFGPDGTLYYAFPGWKIGDWHSQIFLGRSTDLGRTFETVGWRRRAGLRQRLRRSNALPSLAVDPERPNRVYVAWSANYGLWNFEEQVPGGAEASRTTYKRRPYLAISDDGGGPSRSRSTWPVNWRSR